MTHKPQSFQNNIMKFTASSCSKLEHSSIISFPINFGKTCFHRVWVNWKSDRMISNASIQISSTILSGLNHKSQSSSANKSYTIYHCICVGVNKMVQIHLNMSPGQKNQFSNFKLHDLRIIYICTCGEFGEWAREFSHFPFLHINPFNGKIFHFKIWVKTSSFDCLNIYAN